MFQKIFFTKHDHLWYDHLVSVNFSLSIKENLKLIMSDTDYSAGLFFKKNYKNVRRKVWCF